MSFIHLHNHSDYSLLDGALKVEELISRVKSMGMDSVALTDHGNMFGAMNFYLTAKKLKVKPIIGIETYLDPAESLTFSGGKTLLYHLVLLVKDKPGYLNLMKLASKAYREGFYYKPRITREWLSNYHEGLIALSACAHGEIAHNLAQDDPDAALNAAKFYKDMFGDDFYLEVQNHDLEIEDKVRPGIFGIGEKLNIKVVATNDCHYLLPEHAKSHEILLSIGTGTTLADEKRFRYSTTQLFVKSEEEMREAFPDNPEVLENTMEVAGKCNLELDFNQRLLPKFEVPADFDPEISSTQEIEESEQEDNRVHTYLRERVFQGAIKRYGENLPEEIRERLEMELNVIHNMGFSAYFLITQDFTDFARNKGISVGPGRGSAAGSLVSFSLGITNIDPLKYGLLFERFLNPERVTMPDIDIDFADDRREEVIKYVREKYGEDNVTQIITFGKMLARGVVRDVGRVMGFSYGEVDKLAKKIPFILGMTLKRALNEVAELREEVKSNPAYAEMMQHCLTLEGLNRNPGTHAAGVVIAPEDLTNFTPLFKSSEGDITTQYDMGILESSGLLKMDFLGLKTLTIIQNTLEMLKARGIELDIEKIPLNDKDTFKLFQDGRTVALFQFESSGMQEYLKKLKPERLEDLIAMNALYRPGPMQFINDFIERKHGRKEIEYPHPSLAEILEETYGIIVYQEQVIRIAHEFAGFSLGNADILRRAMGKKKKNVMDAMKKDFIAGVKQKGIDPKIGNEIYNLIEKFAQYGFNKSHSAGYALIAYQTGYLKAHYPAEFMAATMTSEMGKDSERIQKLVNECKLIGVQVLPPEINESEMDFFVVPDGIRFGLRAVKNVGEGPVKAILEARERGGKFSTIFQFIEELDQHNVNRKALESLVQAGALDTLEPNRAKLFANIDKLIAYGNAVQSDKEKGQFSIFGGDEKEKVYNQPELIGIEEWSRGDKLRREKEMLGYFVSGHPLEKYRREVESFSSPAIENLDNLPDSAKVRICGLITAKRQQMTRRGSLMAIAALEDFTGSTEVLFFPGEVYDEYSGKLEIDSMVALEGRTSTKEDEAVKIIAEKMYPLEQAREEFTRSVQLTIDSREFDASSLDKLVSILKSHEGKSTLSINYLANGVNLRLRSHRFNVKVDDMLLKDLSDLIGSENVRLGF